MQAKQIVAASVVLSLSLLAVMALVTRFLLHKHPKQTVNNIQTSDGNNEQQDRFIQISDSWKRIFAPKRGQTKGRWVPTMSSIIMAGDEGLFSSTLFDRLHTYPSELSLDALYEVFAEELRSRSLSDRTAYTGHIPRFLSYTRRVASGPKRVQSVAHKPTIRGRTDGSTTNRLSLDLSKTERGVSRSISLKTSAPVLVPLSNLVPTAREDKSVPCSWMKDGQVADDTSTGAAVQITRVEFAALSIIMGCSLEASKQDTAIPPQHGALGISLSASVPKDGKSQAMFHKTQRSPSESPARGSGYSILFAKHLAAGSLPFIQDSEAVKSILITNHTLTTLQSGTSLYLYECNFKTSQSRFLSALPSNRELKLYIASASTKAQSTNPVVNAVAALPFVGGLTPLASVALIQTVRFIVAGGLSSARLLQRLEGLVDKVNRQAPHLNIFGQLYEPQNARSLYREREKLGKIAIGANNAESLAGKLSRVQRYTTLIQRLMAMVPDMKQEEVLIAVKKATEKELQRSYADAVACHKAGASQSSCFIDSHGCPNSDARSKRFSAQSHTSEPRSVRASTESIPNATTPCSSPTFPANNLGKQLEAVLKSELPLSIESIAFVVRMVLVSWTLSAEPVAWDTGEDGFRLPDLQVLPEHMVMC